MGFIDELLMTWLVTKLLLGDSSIFNGDNQIMESPAKVLADRSSVVGDWQQFSFIAPYRIRIIWFILPPAAAEIDKEPKPARLASASPLICQILAGFGAIRSGWREPPVVTTPLTSARRGGARVDEWV